MKGSAYGGCLTQSPADRGAGRLAWKPAGRFVASIETGIAIRSFLVELKPIQSLPEKGWCPAPPWDLAFPGAFFLLFEAANSLFAAPQRRWAATLGRGKIAVVLLILQALKSASTLIRCDAGC